MGMPITAAQARDARATIAPVAFRTPLVPLNAETAADVRLKLENLQPIGSFKIRGAANVMGRTPRERLERGVLTASAGNTAQGVAFCARRLGVPATIVAPTPLRGPRSRRWNGSAGVCIMRPFPLWGGPFWR